LCLQGENADCNPAAPVVDCTAMPTKIKRCEWADGVSLAYIEYHDREWGVPVYDDRTQFEFLVLEGAQAGLSWSTILNKRDGYRKAFADFDPARVARFTKKRIEKLLRDPSIVRNRLKVESAVSNARAFLAVQEEFGSFSDYIWGFVGGRPIRNRFRTDGDIPATSPESDALSKDLRQRGFRFVGSTIVYAHMQATGLVNDHVVGCFRHKPCAALARSKR
jgi:DNA-3-methyladenine glycosylase I